MKIKDIGEFGLIDRIHAKAGRSSYPVIIGIGDDASVLDVGSRNQAVTTTDMLVEGVHFLRDSIDPFDLGFKSHAVNLSDIAAMGATPVQSFLSFGLPPDMDVEIIDRFMDGFLEAGKGVPLSGGDTVSSREGWLISVTVIGVAPAGKVLRRDAAAPGETVWLCGPLGDSAAGLSILLGESRKVNEEDADFLIQRHNRPLPQLRMGRILLETGISHCAIDVSDGLLQDLGHICECSQLGAELELESIPLSRPIRELAAANGVDPYMWALKGGEDYSILFTVKEEKEKKLITVLEREEIEAFPIGRMVRGEGIVVYRDGSPMDTGKVGGFDHFRENP
ncbi:MAG: thiamine-phosphate kinase [bacterium]|nr:MAG: thiamine-phosphate kinase [bacterium]